MKSNSSVRAAIIRHVCFIDYWVAGDVYMNILAVFLLYIILGIHWQANPDAIFHFFLVVNESNAFLGYIGLIIPIWVAS